MNPEKGNTKNSQSVGILGGGQLARMLAESAHRLGLQPLILADSVADPAAQICPGAILGSMKDPVVLRRFFSQVQLAVFENEFVDTELLSEAAGGRTVFLPSLETISKLQDKHSQKEALSLLGIPTSPYLVYGGGGVDAWVDEVFRKYGRNSVFKWAKFGYDGKGTLISPKNVDEAAEFCERGLERSGVFAEEKVRFKRELSLVSAFSVQGVYQSFPLVVSEQDNGICKKVVGPATAFGVPVDLQEEARRHALKLAKHFELHGVFAIEFFETEDGRLLVNEIAPRVHNTGHFSQDAANISQFECHWRAVLGLPLREIDTAPAFAMLNLLGTIETEGSTRIPSPGARCHLHWYGKSEARAGRKVGHLNGAARSIDGLPRILEEMAEVEWRWIHGKEDEAEE